MSEVNGSNEVTCPNYCPTSDKTSLISLFPIGVSGLLQCCAAQRSGGQIAKTWTWLTCQRILILRIRTTRTTTEKKNYQYIYSKPSYLACNSENGNFLFRLTAGRGFYREPRNIFCQKKLKPYAQHRPRKQQLKCLFCSGKYPPSSQRVFTQMGHYWDDHSDYHDFHFGKMHCLPFVDGDSWIYRKNKSVHENS